MKLRPVRLLTVWHKWFAWYPIRIGGRLVWMRYVWREDGVDPDPRRCWTKYRMTKWRPRRTREEGAQ